MVDIDTLVNCINVSRRDIGGAFLSAQEKIGIPVQDRKDFEAVVQTNDDKLAYRQAFKYSQQIPDMYNELVRVIYYRGYDNGTLHKLLEKKTKKKKSNLQGLHSASFGYLQASFMTLGQKGRGWAGKVLINNNAMGSGVLIGPNRFLTAWHAIASLFEVNEKAEIVPKNKPVKLEVMFDHYEDNINGTTQMLNPKKIKAADDWLEVYSPTYTGEYDTLPEDLTALRGYWDYAIIRLAEHLDAERTYAKLEPRAVIPDVGAPIVVYQYPDGVDLKIAIHEIADDNPPIPNVRFLHTANTAKGSSGGPCFDREFYLVGLHQGEWPKKIKKKTVNRGIAIRDIIYDIETKKNKNEALLGQHPEDYLAWYINRKTYDPIIGIDDLQYIVLSIPNEQGNIICIQGTPRSGKTYCVAALASLLQDAMHMKIVMPAEDISKMDCLSLARHICSMAGDSSIKFDDFETYNSTRPAWLKDEVAQKIIGVLESRRNNRKVWLAITSLNVHEIKDNNTNDLLLLLYDFVKQTPWLQFVLDGIEADLPAALSPCIVKYETKQKQLLDIKNYIVRFLKELNTIPEVAMVNAFSQFLFNEYSALLANNPEQAMATLNEKCKNFFLSFMKQIK